MTVWERQIARPPPVASHIIDEFEGPHGIRCVIVVSGVKPGTGIGQRRHTRAPDLYGDGVDWSDVRLTNGLTRIPDALRSYNEAACIYAMAIDSGSVIASYVGTASLRPWSGPWDLRIARARKRAEEMAERLYWIEDAEQDIDDG